MNRANAIRCEICGETDPMPRSMCLAKLTGTAKKDRPCLYSREADERLKADLEAMSRAALAPLNTSPEPVRPEDKSEHEGRHE